MQDLQTYDNSEARSFGFAYGLLVGTALGAAILRSRDSDTLLRTLGVACLLGTISLARTDYTSANRTFGATGTASTMVQSGPVVTITLGTPSAAASTAAGTGTLSWTPSASATDRAGNAASIIPGSESGSADVDF